jgi:hypothetical protein
LDHEGDDLYFLNKLANPAWFRAIHAMTDDDALAEVERIVREEAKEPGPDVEWGKQLMSKAMALKAVDVARKELLKAGEPVPSDEVLLSMVARLDWKL